MTGTTAYRAAKYRTIVADPPWDVERSFGGANWANGERDRPDLPYQTMSLEDIADLPVHDWTAKDAHLYLWTTRQYLHDAPFVAHAWGFRPVATLIWCKPPGGFVGGTFYPNVEYVLFCRRGTLKASERMPSSWFTWPRSDHSAKPDAFLDMVERVSPAPRLEMFARRQRLGWDTWGNEALEHVEVARDA